MCAFAETEDNFLSAQNESRGEKRQSFANLGASHPSGTVSDSTLFLGQPGFMCGRSRYLLFKTSILCHSVSVAAYV